MNNTRIGYCVFSTYKRSSGRVGWDNEPLAFGQNDEDMAPDQLLRRGAVQFFDTEEEAMAALERTLKTATAEGAEWPKRFSYAVLQVLKQVPAG